MALCERLFRSARRMLEEESAASHKVFVATDETAALPRATTAARTKQDVRGIPAVLWLWTGLECGHSYCSRATAPAARMQSYIMANRKLSISRFHTLSIMIPAPQALHPPKCSGGHLVAQFAVFDHPFKSFTNGAGTAYW